MEFESKELANAAFVKPNSTHVSMGEVSSKDLKDQIKISLIIKDKKLIKWYEMYSMREYKNASALETLIYLIRSLRDEFVLEHKEDNVKNLTIRRSFDNILLSLDLMLINKLDISSDVMNTILLAFLSKNFI